MSPPASRLVRILLIIAGGSAHGLMGQTEPFWMADTTVTACFGELTDSGGPDEAYGNNEDLVFTVDAGAPLIVGFIGSIDIEPGAPNSGLLFDYLVLHDGPGLASPVLDTLYGSISTPPSYVTSGALTVHFVSDASAQPQGFHLFWTADPPPPQPPDMDLSAPGSCPFQAVEWSFDPPLECALIDWASLAVTSSSGDAWPVDTSAAILLGCGSGWAASLILPFDDGATIAGNCDIMASMEVGIRDACDSVWTMPLSAQWASTGCGAVPEIEADTDTVCTGGCVVLEAIPRGCGPTQFAWSGSDGSTWSGPGPWTACPTVTTTYTVTATETASGVTGSASVQVVVIDLGAWVADTVLCPGDVLILSTGPVQGNWTGPGVTGPPWAFHADSSGAGQHEITFLTTGGGGCSSTSTIGVTGFSVPEVIATCPESSPFALTGFPSGGTWSGIGMAGDLFNPAAADTLGTSPFTLTYEAAGCTGLTQVHVEPAADPIALDAVCQSEPPITLPNAPPGGTWSGPGWNATEGQWVPQDAPPGPTVLTYAMEGCDRTAFGVVLPIHAGPTMTSCPEQSPFIPFPGFLPPGGTWSGPGIGADGASTGLYDPGSVPDGLWAPLIYAAPNGCQDTLWMFNRQTTVSPAVLYSCAGDEDNLLMTNGFQASPWCGTWTSEPVDVTAYLGDCDWSLTALDLTVGVHEAIYEVNGCSDTLEVIVHPEALLLSDWTSCIDGDPIPLPETPPGSQWEGEGLIGPAGDGTWEWSPSGAGQGDHALIWSTPAGCADTALVFVEAPPTWPAPALTGTWCFNDAPQLPPGPTNPGNGPPTTQDDWSLDGAPWPPGLTTASVGEGTHEVSLGWSGEACTVEQTWSFVVLPPLTVELQVEDASLCAGQGTSATAVLSGGLADGGSTPDITWSDGGFPSPERFLLPEASGWWWVEADDGCSTPAMDSVYLGILPPFMRSVTHAATACFGAPTDVVLEAGPPAGLVHILDGDTLGIGTFSIATTAGVALDWILVDPVEGCAQDTTILIPSHPPLNAAFSVFPASDCIPWDAQPIGLIDLSNGGETGTWAWWAGEVAEIPDGAASSGELPWSLGTNPTLSFPAPGQWTVALALDQEAGCTDTAFQSLCILPQTNIWLPDAFSPNGDTWNDRFHPRGSGVQSWEWIILDAWGQVVWEERHDGFPAASSLGPTDPWGMPVGWEGTVQSSGLPAPTGVYAISLKARTDGGWPIEIQQPIRLIR